MDGVTSAEALAHARALLAEVQQQVQQQAEEIARIKATIGGAR